MKRQASLQRPLILWPVAIQFLTLFAAAAILMATALRFDSGGPYTEETVARVVAEAIGRDENGALQLRSTRELEKLRGQAPGLWFVAEDDRGERLSSGRVPPHFDAMRGRLRDLSYAQIRGRYPPHDVTAVVRRETGPAGPLTVIAHGKLSELSFTVLMASNLFVIPVCLVLALISVVVTPWIVRRSLAGVSRIAREADRIDIDQRGLRLSEEYAPNEVAPLVRAMNDALGRLDEGYERQRRFIASAAHELRTPIAILRLKIESADEPATRRLASDIERLECLAEQLLDIQRLDQGRHFEPVDLAALARRVAGDLAPLLIESGRSVEVEVERGRNVSGDAAALERLLSNLVHNAAQHGGRHVVIRTFEGGIEVEDDGPGIPEDQRERVFEPFHRLRPRSSGSGLGLSLVQQVAERHDASVSITGAPEGGTIVRIVFPKVTQGSIEGDEA